MVYQWKTGSQHKVAASVAGEVVAKLAEENRLNASELVDESRPEDAPLHSEFEWNDSVAAEKYREDQARGIIRHLTVKFEQDNEEYQTRAFFILRPEEKNYEPVQLILRDEDKHKMLLEQAKGELKAFKAKYTGLIELAKVIDTIEEVIKT